MSIKFNVATWEVFNGNLSFYQIQLTQVSATDIQRTWHFLIAHFEIVFSEIDGDEGEGHVQPSCETSVWLENLKWSIWLDGVVGHSFVTLLQWQYKGAVELFHYNLVIAPCKVGNTSACTLDFIKICYTGSFQF